ncbi:MAG: nucleotide pyrophosphatase [Candidatus Aminicenantes bacterium]|nr:nucleotide pyrophosphatase [Candidatus Aminicenantes bacterium]
MGLKKDTNYIVSGLERSGTSMIMQILNAGGIPVAFDFSSRPPDENNPKGYYELEGGKIINKLMEGAFPLDRYQGQFIKITSFGMRFLPQGKYKVIYTQRNIEEVLDSMEKMSQQKDDHRQETRESFMKLDNLIQETIKERKDINQLFVNYNQILKDPEKNIRKIRDFIQETEADLDQMIKSVDLRLYRNREIKDY